MSRCADPRTLLPGDVVSPTFNPSVQLVFDRFGLARIGDAMPNHAQQVPPDTIVWLVFGTRQDTGRPDRLLLRKGDDVRLLMRDGKRVDAR